MRAGLPSPGPAQMEIEASRRRDRSLGISRRTSRKARKRAASRTGLRQGREIDHMNMTDGILKGLGKPGMKKPFEAAIREKMLVAQRRCSIQDREPPRQGPCLKRGVTHVSNPPDVSVAGHDRNIDKDEWRPLLNGYQRARSAWHRGLRARCRTGSLNLF